MDNSVNISIDSEIINFKLGHSSKNFNDHDQNSNIDNLNIVEDNQNDLKEQINENIILKTDTEILDDVKKDPSFIPRKGKFFEHDDRLGDEDIENMKSSNTSKNYNRKLGIESDRWKHDRFDPDQQTPKSTRDIIRIYGYDIRKELNNANNKVDNLKNNKEEIKKESNDNTLKLENSVDKNINISTVNNNQQERHKNFNYNQKQQNNKTRNQINNYIYDDYVLDSDHNYRKNRSKSAYNSYNEQNINKGKLILKQNNNINIENNNINNNINKNQNRNKQNFKTSRPKSFNDNDGNEQNNNQQRKRNQPQNTNNNNNNNIQDSLKHQQQKNQYDVKQNQNQQELPKRYSTMRNQRTFNNKSNDNNINLENNNNNNNNNSKMENQRQETNLNQKTNNNYHSAHSKHQQQQQNIQQIASQHQQYVNQTTYYEPNNWQVPHSGRPIVSGTQVQVHHTHPHHHPHHQQPTIAYNQQLATHQIITSTSATQQLPPPGLSSPQLVQPQYYYLSADYTNQYTTTPPQAANIPTPQTSHQIFYAPPNSSQPKIITQTQQRQSKAIPIVNPESTKNIDINKQNQ